MAGDRKVTTPHSSKPANRLRRTPNSAAQNGVSTKDDTVADHEGRGQQALTRSVVGREADVRQKVVIGDEDRDIDPVHVGNGDDHEQRDHAPPAQRA
jgi:hypothetical protein